ncbi:MFS transporter [Rubripirellula reticaptiva]|uniref:Major Facilitator Superfamily protein n=1 Tax=Rubripirellula reticaptiva TaxID=2528013 RepID=A0A5C6EB84_9BACT|nr:MFS transporter [Rubripirellula reticaptiva]TWU47003.1 Major Facilitator Superfamily protein [Rubripirellula reticaptiva]
MDRSLAAPALAASERFADLPSRANDPNLSRSMGDAACFGGMVGCGETYFSAFALAVGLGETAAGLVASIPLLVGGVLQLGSPYAIKRIGGYRRWIVLGASLQALAFLPLALAAWNETLTLPMMLIIASVYWAAGLSTGPAWNTWMEQIVPSQHRARFFSKRSRLQQTCTFVSLMIAGLILHWTSKNGIALIGFAGLFCAAAGFRLVSAGFLHRTREPKTKNQPIESTTKPVADLGQIASTDTRPAMRLLAYLVAMQVFIQLSGPYFVPYMLGQLEFGYGVYVSLVAIAFLSKVISLNFWGRIAERSGASKVLWFGGIGLVPLASLWILSTNLYWLALIQILSGIAWAAYELGFFLMFFETMPANQRTRLLTYYNFANTLAVCTGALTGAAILATLGCESRTYYYLFGISSTGRMLCLGLLAGVVLPKGSLKTIRMRILSVRLGAGSVTAPITASAEEN